MKTPPFGAPDVWQELDELVAAADGRAAFKQLLEQSLARVTEWRWANDAVYQPVPFHAEIYKAPAPKWKKAPNGSLNIHHGIDAKEVVWIMRIWPSAIKETCGQGIIKRRPGVDDHFHYLGTWPGGNLEQAPKTVKLKGVNRRLFRADRQLATAYSLWDRGPAMYDYEYENNRLVRSVFLADHPDKGFFTRRAYFYTYAADGGIEEIRYEHYLMPEGRLVEKKVSFRRKIK